jgi:hypothetical protein
MKQIFTSLAFLLLASFTMTAQSNEEREAIKEMCGCFEVDFKYAETFAHQEDYEFYDPYEASALELVIMEEESPTKMVLQHLLVINDTMFIKHWRQDWEYEPKRLFTFQGNDTWESSRLKSKDTRGQWSQEVYQVDDSPRYSGTATWFLADGKKVWENTSNAPLPRREYTKRSDYQIMRRTNGHVIEDWGWTHEQDNEKVALVAKGEKLISEEKGRNTYRRTDSERCTKAIDWWESRRAFWKLVREDWDEYLSQSRTFHIKPKVDNKRMYKKMYDLESTEYATEKEARKAIKELLDAYRSDAKDL